MKKTRSAKRALLMSALSLLLCVSMLVGTTFAWFTDSVTSAGNIIQSGNLDIEVEYTLDGENWADLDGAKNLFQKDLWEPGHTEVVALKIKNNGSLALKYVANMNILNEVIGKNKDGGDIVLSEILTVTTVTHQVNMIGDILLDMVFSGSKNTDTENTTTFKNGNILANDQELLPGDAHYVMITVDMAETVGNEANHDGVHAPSIEFGVNVLATQYTYEEDSFGNQYDKYASVATVAEMKDALAKGITELNFMGKEINLNKGLSKAMVPAGTTVTIANAVVSGKSYGNGADGTVIFENCTFTNTGAYSIHFDNGEGDVIFKNCELYGWNSFGSTLNSVSFYDCALYGNGTYALIRSYANLYVENCYIDTTNANHNDGYSEGVEAVSGATLTEKNNTYVATTLSEVMALAKKGNTTIDAKGANLGDYYYSGTFANGTVLKNAKFTYVYGASVDGLATFENCEFVSDHSYSANFSDGSYKGKVVFNNCSFDGWSSFGDAITAVEMNKCTFKMDIGNYGILRFYQNAVLNDCEFASSFEGVDTNKNGTVVNLNRCTGIDGKIYNNGSVVGEWIVDGVKLNNVTSW